MCKHIINAKVHNVEWGFDLGCVSVAFDQVFLWIISYLIVVCMHACVACAAAWLRAHMK